MHMHQEIIMLKKNYLAPLAVALAVAFGAAPALAKNDHGGGHGGGKHAEKAEKHAAKAEKHELKAEKHELKAEKHAFKAQEKAQKHALKDQEGFERQIRRSDTRVLGAAPARPDVRVGSYFNDDHRRYAREYYVQHYGSGKSCPPGLAKKNNGCMPPGHARSYEVGQALPSGVQYYSVPQPVVTYLPPAPYGYQYVRVNNDIVLMSTRDRIIVDVLRNLLG
jgi:hypothetical protein